MGIDLRWPIGLLLASIGGILVFYGAVSDPEIYRQSLDFDVNLWWGGIMAIAGLATVGFARSAGIRG